LLLLSLLWFEGIDDSEGGLRSLYFSLGLVMLSPNESLWSYYYIE
jgi:hypothetical protein